MTIPKQSRIARIVLATVSLGLILSAGRTIWGLWQRRDVIRLRETELVRLREENRGLERALLDMQGEAYIERIARDKLGMLREREAIVILPEGTGRGEPGAGMQKNSLPNWKRWWRLFF